MGTTTFSGPVKAGTIREGSSANVGFVEMAQTAAWTQSATGDSTGIIIPAGSQITEITLYVTVIPTAVNLSGGTSATATELFTGLAQGSAANVIKQASAATITDADAWADVGTSDVTIFLKSASGTTGRGYVTVKYIQNNNLA